MGGVQGIVGHNCLEHGKRGRRKRVKENTDIMQEVSLPFLLFSIGILSCQQVRNKRFHGIYAVLKGC